jgi:hypothetical protein
MFHILLMMKWSQARSKRNPNLAKSSQIGPSLRKAYPRIRLGFPWISLFLLSLFKDLRQPPGPKIFSGPFLPFKVLTAWHAHGAALAVALLVGVVQSGSGVHQPTL